MKVPKDTLSEEDHADYFDVVEDILLLFDKLRGFALVLNINYPRALSECEDFIRNLWYLENPTQVPWWWDKTYENVDD